MLVFSTTLLFLLLVHTDSLEIKWNRPRVIEKGSDISNFANSPEAYVAMHKLVGLSTCASKELKTYPSATFRWTFTETNGKNAITKTEKICATTWTATYEGRFNVKLELLDGAKVVATNQTVIDVRDLWFVLIGDSFVSGEGCPNTRANIQAFKFATWISSVCHRSNNSYGYITYKSIVEKYPKYGLLFTYLACSGASIQTGLLGTYYEPAQVEVIKSIGAAVKKTCFCASCCKVRPDMIVFSIGGNDMDFSNVVKGLLTGTAAAQFSAAPAKLKELEKRFTRLGDAFVEIGTPPKGIFFVEYFDLVKNSGGSPDTNCAVVGQGDPQNFELAETQIRKPMNDIIVATCAKYGWNFIGGVDKLFSSHGVCSSDAYVGSVTDALSVQGDLNGAFHPNYKGHRFIAPIVWKTVSSYLTKIMWVIA